MSLSHRYIHLLEKIQVELAALAALVVVYVLLAPAVAAADPEAPITFLPDGRLGEMAMLAGIVWLAAAGCALVTVSARPEGAILATMIGAGGISLYSPRLQALLWERQGNIASVFSQLRLETLLLSLVLLGAVVVIAVVREGMRAWKPQWMWKSPLSVLGVDGFPQAKPGKGDKAARSDPSEAPSALPAPRGGLRGVLERMDLLGISRDGKIAGPGKAGMLCVKFFAMGLVISIACLFLLLQAPQRGQILFALLASFVVAVVIAHQVFPAPYSIVAWMMPIATSVVLYTLAAAAAGSGVDAWARVEDYSRALPVDWLTAGSGGAVLGYWISERLHEMKFIERHQEKTKGA